MSFQAMSWAVEQKLPATKKIVLLMLANRVNSDTGKCIPKIKTLAEDCGLSESATKSALKELAEIGLLKVHPRFYEGQQLPNQYELCPAGVGLQKTHPSLQKTPVGQQVATESGKESVNEPKDKHTKADYSALFDVFWKAYPSKVGKDAARKAFAKRKFDEKTFAQVLQALELHKVSERWTKDNGQYIPNPATWLNQGRWEDEMPGTAPGGDNLAFAGII